MIGFSDKTEAAVLDSVYGVTLFLRLLQWTGASGQGPGKTVNDDGSLPTGLVEITTGGYAPISIPSTSWNAAVGGAPSTKSVPKLAASPIGWTPSGASWLAVCSYAWTSNSSAITSSNFVSSGLMIDGSGNAVTYDIVDGQPFQFTNTSPITEYIGDPAAGTNPT